MAVHFLLCNRIEIDKWDTHEVASKYIKRHKSTFFFPFKEISLVFKPNKLTWLPNANTFSPELKFHTHTKHTTQAEGDSAGDGTASWGTKHMHSRLLP